MIRIESWILRVAKCGRYFGPGQVPIALRGFVFMHPKYPAGSLVDTTNIISSEGRTVRTRNNVYFLGSIDEYYEKWLLTKKNYQVSRDNPLCFLGAMWDDWETYRFITGEK